MPLISQETVLTDVEHILGSGGGTLDFAVAGENSYYTWHGVEDAEWSVEGVERVENDDEDRFLIYPEGDFFTCEIGADGEEHNSGPVHCYSE
ncbi:hypothetical protein GCM10028857_03170 [Salinarchaeum chitinilyticum]